MNSITRDVFVKRRGLTEVIPYIRNTNAQPLQFRFCDFTIPENARAQVYVQKPSGKAVYNSAAISGNIVTVNVETQMFSEIGICILQLRISQGEDILVTFDQPVKVYPNFTEGDAEQSRNENGFFGEYEKRVSEAIEKVNNLQDKADRGDFTGSIKIGKVETGEAGSKASVKNTGSEKNAVLDITIPRGDKGASLRLRGKWMLGAEYFNNAEHIDIVTYDGSTYGCTESNTASEDIQPTNTDYWIRLVEKGETGNMENISTVKIPFAEVSERDNINQDDTISSIFGKIKKWLDDILNGAASTLLGTNLAKNRVLISDALGKVSISNITTTELGHLSGLIRNVQEQLSEKIASSKIVKSTEITEEGFLMDGKIASEKFNILKGKSIEDVVTNSSGTAIKYANGFVTQYGRSICSVANPNIAQTEITLPIPIDINKAYSTLANRSAMGNAVTALTATSYAQISGEGKKLIIGLQQVDGQLNTFSDQYRTVSWLVSGFWK